MFAAWTLLAGIALFVIGARILRFQKNLRYLKDIEYAVTSSWPKISFVIPACNEESTIALALESLLKIDYPNYEIIFVEDRSKDRTGEIAEKIAREDSRLKVLRIESLPVGWLGKTHALNEGSKVADGEWLLFTDADIHYSRHTLKKAMAFVLKENLDFLAVSPQLHAPGFFLHATLAQFFHQGSLSLDVKKIADPQLDYAVGIGAFNFIRRSRLEALGGFKEIRLDVIDDGALAYFAKKTGGRCGFLSGLSEVFVEWYPGLRALVRGLEKNAFAIFNYSWPRLLTLTIAVWISAAFVGIPLFFFDRIPLSTKLVYLSGLIFYFLVSGYSLQKSAGVPALYALSLPVTVLLTPLISLRAAWLNARHKGIFWRSTFYPLFLLRREQKFKVLDMLSVRPRSGAEQPPAL